MSALRHEPNAFARNPFGCEPADALTEERHVAAARWQKSDDRVHARGLTRAVSPEQRQNPCCVHRERNVMQHMTVAVERVDVARARAPQSPR